jgi:hypothetical protein
MEDVYRIAAALRQIGRGFDALATALEGETVSASERYLAALREWGQQGLSRAEASALLRRHGFAPQMAGAWARDRWIETRDDGLRYLAQRSHDWVAQREDEK